MRTLTRRLEIIEPNMLLVGIDLAGKNNVAILIDQKGRRLSRLKFNHHRWDYDRLKDWLQDKAEEHQAKLLVGMEPTNHYWKLVAAELERAGILYRLVNAYSVKKHREGKQLSRAKDDPRDGYFIADLTRVGTFTDSQLLHGSYAELRQYNALYARLRKNIARQKVLLRQAVGQTFPELTEAFKDPLGQTAQSLLLTMPSAWRIRQWSEEAFISQVRANFNGRGFQGAKLRQAYQLAQDSIGLVDTLALELTIRGCLQMLTLLTQQLAEVEEQLLATFATLPEAKTMPSLGLGTVTTARILAEIGDPSAYRSARQLVKLAGIQPVPDSSGRQQNGKTPISGKGRARLRTHLYFACLRLIQNDAEFAAYYAQLKERAHNPLKGMQALCVLMHKVLHILWAVQRDGTTYDPAVWRKDRAN